jgi:hypothetical protein
MEMAQDNGLAAGAVNTITLILREPFDYMQWQRQLWADRSVDDLSKAAMAMRNASPNEGMESTR